MGKSDNHISHLPEGTPRPSLFGSSAPADDHNIFDSIDGRTNASPAARPRRLIWLLTPLLALAAWGVATQLQKQTESEPDVRVAVAAAVPVAPTLPPAPAASAKAEPASDPFTTLQATAVAAIPPTAPPSSQAAPAFDMQAALEKPTTPPAASTPTRSATAKEAVKPPVKKAETRPAPPKATAQKVPPRGEAKIAVKATEPAVKKPNAGDPDVELLSAIMKHLGDERGATGGPARSSQTIADLVKSCRGKDPIEALLCQRRICEGSWGKAQACPQNLAPKQTASAKGTPANH